MVRNKIENTDLALFGKLKELGSPLLLFIIIFLKNQHQHIFIFSLFILYHLFFIII